MCIKPLHLRNPKIHFIRQKDPVWVDVPCGRCYECRQRRSSDYQFRAYQHSRDIVSRGGSVHFVTLTYNDEHLPFCDIVKSDGIYNFYLRRPCFSGRHLDLFKYQLKNLCERDLHCSYSYILTSEFGEKKGRPHYHAIIWLSKSFPRARVVKMLRHAWPNGFIRDDVLNGDVFAAVGYVVKYAMKSDDSLDVFRRSYRYFRDGVELERKEVFPRTRISINLGMSFVENLDTSDIVNMFLRGKFPIRISDTRVRELPLPAYYFNKMCKSSHLETIDGRERHICDVSNFGEFIKDKRENERIKKDIEDFNVFLSYNRFNIENIDLHYFLKHRLLLLDDNAVLARAPRTGMAYQCFTDLQLAKRQSHCAYLKSLSDKRRATKRRQANPCYCSDEVERCTSTLNV